MKKACLRCGLYLKGRRSCITFHHLCLPPSQPDKAAFYWPGLEIQTPVEPSCRNNQIALPAIMINLLAGWLKILTALRSGCSLSEKDKLLRALTALLESRIWKEGNFGQIGLPFRQIGLPWQQLSKLGQNCAAQQCLPLQIGLYKLATREIAIKSF